MKAHAKEELNSPDLIGLLQLDAAGFKSRFASSPILRTKRRGLLRNVCVALGNTGDASALPALDKASRDVEPLIAEHARWAIKNIRHGAASPKEGQGDERPPKQHVADIRGHGIERTT